MSADPMEQLTVGLRRELETRRWNKTFEHADATVTPEHDGSNLEAWINTQRSEYKKGKLSPERIERLESLKGWTWDPQESAWKKGFEQLERHIEEHGHARVPKNHVTSDGYKLGKWVDTQRTAYKKGKLSAERVERLDSLGDWA